MPCDKINSALHGATHSTNGTRIRQVLRNSAIALNRQVHEFHVVYVEDNLHGLAANLAIFNVRLSTSGEIDDDAHRFRAIRAADRSVQKQGAHVCIKAANACRPTASR